MVFWSPEFWFSGRFRFSEDINISFEKKCSTNFIFFNQGHLLVEEPQLIDCSRQEVPSCVLYELASALIEFLNVFLNHAKNSESVIYIFHESTMCITIIFLFNKRRFCLSLGTLGLCQHFQESIKAKSTN